MQVIHGSAAGIDAGEVVAEQFPSLRLHLVRFDFNGPRTVIAVPRRDVPAVPAGSR